MTPLRAQVLETAEELKPYEEAWDALAAQAQRPYCAPAWMLAWWREAAEEGSALRAVVVLDGEELAGIAPFYVEPRSPGLTARYRPLASSLSARIEPLARVGWEPDVAAAVAVALAGAEPEPGVIVFENVLAASPWPQLLARSWPALGEPWVERHTPIAAPTLAIAGLNLDDWLASKSRNFRGQMRRARRKLEKQGAVFRMSESEDELERDLIAFARLHRARWDFRGGSAVLHEPVERMLADAGRALLPSQRFRLFSIELEGRTVSSQLFLAAGGELAYWLGGFDESLSSQWPSLQGLVQALEDGFERGEDRFDLGAGAQHYKYRFADGEDKLETVMVVPRGRRYALARAQLVPGQVRRELARRLPPGAKARLRALLRQGDGGEAGGGGEAGDRERTGSHG